MKKKLVILLLTLACLFGLAGVTACDKEDGTQSDIGGSYISTGEGSASTGDSQSSKESGSSEEEAPLPTAGLVYTLSDDGTYYIVSGIGTAMDTDIVIPSTYNNKPVRVIGEDAFADCIKLTSVTIPDSVQMIGSYAFWDCTNLTSVTIPDSVQTLEEGAFSGCSNLTSVTIPDSVQTIGWYAFDDCTKLIQIENGVHYVDNWVVDCDTSVTSVSLRANTKGVGHWAFRECSNLTSITVAEDNTYYASVDGNLYNKDKTTLIQYAIGKTETSFTIPNHVQTIDYGAFSRCNLTSIIIPDSVEVIEDRAFLSCYNLTSITIGKGVQTIGEDAFDNYDKLTNITVAEGNMYYASQDGILYNKEKTAFIYIPKGISGAITIPDSIQMIEDKAFFHCTNLTSITVAEGNAYYTSIDGNLYNKDKTTLIQYATGKTAMSFTVPDGVQRIGGGAFYDCDSLTSVTIPDSVETIEESAFEYCHKLARVTIPDSVETIGTSAFRGCDELTSVTIGNNVQTIGEAAFYSCRSLTSITIGNDVQTIRREAFFVCRNLTSVYYHGEENQWNEISIDDNNSHLTSATRYYYSADEPVVEGKYWRYINGMPTPW